jgi:hypothetical protein
MQVGINQVGIPERLSKLLLAAKPGRHQLQTRRWREYRVTPRANPRAFRRELLYGALVQLKRV